MIRPLAAFLTSAALGVLIWYLSPVITSCQEPWDSGSWYYLTALILCGSIVALMAGRTNARLFWVWCFPLVVGQLAYMLVVLPSGPLLLVGIFFLFVYSTVSILGAGLTAIALRWFHQRR
jgi:hypothetical protein